MTPSAGAGGAFAELGVGDLLAQAFDLYKRHARALLLTCAVLFVPASIVKSCAVSVILAPTVASRAFAEQATRGAQAWNKTNEKLAAKLNDGLRKGQIDPKALEAVGKEMEAEGNQAGAAAAGLAGAATSAFMLALLAAVGAFVTALIMYGFVVPLTHGAVTIAIADRVLGGDAGWREVWTLLFRRLAKLMSAMIPAAILVAIGFVLLILPGFVLAFLFAFVSEVVLIEGVGGTAALKRSKDLVMSDWLRVAIVLVVFGVLNWLAHVIVGAIMPRSALFFGGLLSDLVTLVLMPFPIIGAVLLYFDIRRKLDGFDHDRLRTELDALRAR